MRPHSLPACPFCRGATPAKNFRGGGGSIGGEVGSMHYQCPTCGTSVLVLDNRAGNLAVYVHPQVMNEPDGDEPKTYPEVLTSWIDHTLLPTWRDWVEKYENHKTLEWEKWLKEVFYVQFPELYGRKMRDETTGEETGYVLFDDHNISYPESMPEAQKLYDDQFYGGDTTHSGREKVGTYLPLPPEILNTPTPPKAPRMTLKGQDLIPMFTLEDDGSWILLDKGASAHLPVPEDPRIRKNREFFEKVWAGVASQQNLGQPLPSRIPCKNQYSGDCGVPWYKFNLDDVSFTVGWRHRVVSIRVKSPRLLPTKDIKALADRDNTTYEAHGPLHLRTAADVWDMLHKEEAYSEDLRNEILSGWQERFPEGERVREGGWKSDMPEAEIILIHAWNLETCIEYLTTLCKIVLESR